MTYPSKVDGWVGAVLALVPAALLLEAIFLRSALVGALTLSVLVVYALVIFPTNYTIGPDALIVRSGAIRRSIPYQEIQAVRASRSWLSSPALSLDRLEIALAHGNSRTLISPRDRAGFLRELAGPCRPRQFRDFISPGKQATQHRRACLLSDAFSHHAS